MSTDLSCIKLDCRKKYILHAGSFLNTNTRPAQDVIFHIADNRVDKIGTFDQCNTNCKAWEHTEWLDLKGYYVLPGLVDCHVHLALNGGGQDPGSIGQDSGGQDLCARGFVERGPDAGPQSRDSHDCGNVEMNLCRLREHGILVVRDAGDKGCGVLRGQNNRTGEHISRGAPFVVPTGFALRRRGMYGSFLGPGLQTKDEVKTAIDELATRGAKQIKVLATGVVSFSEYGGVGPEQFSFEELSFLVGEAGKRGLKVMAHANSAQAVKSAARAGVHSIEHGYFLDDSCLDIMLEKGVYWVPTIVPVANAARKLKTQFSPAQLLVIERTYRKQQDIVCQAFEKGVKVAIGTDSGAPGTVCGESYLEEMLLFQEAGVDVADIIRAATNTGLEVLGLDSGGMLTTFIATKENPLLNLAVLGRRNVTVYT